MREKMKKSGAAGGQSAAELIDGGIAELGDWQIGRASGRGRVSMWV
jgi:hypothetical protein